MGKALLLIVMGAGFLLARQGLGNQITERETRKDQIEYEEEVTVRSSHPSAPASGLLTVSRVISYDPSKADADMEARCGPIGAGNGTCTAGTATTGTIED